MQMPKLTFFFPMVFMHIHWKQKPEITYMQKAWKCTIKNTIHNFFSVPACCRMKKKWEVSKHPSVFAVCSAQSTYFVKQAIVSVHSFSLFFTYNSNFYQRAFTVDYQSITKSQFSVYKELRVCQQEVNSLSTNS